MQGAALATRWNCIWAVLLFEGLGNPPLARRNTSLPGPLCKRDVTAAHDQSLSLPGRQVSAQEPGVARRRVGVESRGDSSHASAEPRLSVYGVRSRMRSGRSAGAASTEIRRRAHFLGI